MSTEQRRAYSQNFTILHREQSDGIVGTLENSLRFGSPETYCYGLLTRHATCLTSGSYRAYGITRYHFGPELFTMK
ncbi:hypothetical protein KM043_018755 [Ampulex compressa]|nr:hypothetical protein KM043_018755 [Ampulex compressa]